MKKSNSVKKFNASLFQAGFQNDVPEKLVKDLFLPYTGSNHPAVEIGDSKFVVVVEKIGPYVYKGEFKRYGNDDLPHAGTLDGYERELELLQEEMTIDRNYFLFFTRERVLIWQENRRASSVLVFGHYLSLTLSHTVAFSPVLTPESTHAFLLSQHKTKSIEFSVAKPLNPKMYSGSSDGDHVLRLLAGLGGMTGVFKISANGLGIRGRTLNAARALGLGNFLIDSGTTRRVKVNLEGVDHPVDLIADRLRMPIHVEMNGRYPVPQSIFSELQKVKDFYASDLLEIFGT